MHILPTNFMKLGSLTLYKLLYLLLCLAVIFELANIVLSEVWGLSPKGVVRTRCLLFLERRAKKGILFFKIIKHIDIGKHKKSTTHDHFPHSSPFISKLASALKEMLATSLEFYGLWITNSVSGSVQKNAISLYSFFLYFTTTTKKKCYDDYYCGHTIIIILF